jgi:ribosome biogenesis protein MAK21
VDRLPFPHDTASDEDSSDDELDFPIEEDSDDLLDLDDMPNIPLTSAFPDSDEEAEEEELDAGTKRKRGGKEDKKERKKKRKLPTLASAEDYAALINDGPEDDL